MYLIYSCENVRNAIHIKSASWLLIFLLPTSSLWTKIYKFNNNKQLLFDHRKNMIKFDTP